MTAHASILEQWLSAAAGAHGEQSAHPVATEHDPFRNPIGHVLRVNLAALVAELDGAMDPSVIAKAFENIVAVRAIQDVSVEQALGFVYALRRIVRAELPGADMNEMDRRIDSFSLAAFTQFLQCRERLLGLRLNERLRELGPASHRLRVPPPQAAPSCTGCTR